MEKPQNTNTQIYYYFHNENIIYAIKQQPSPSLLGFYKFPQSERSLAEIKRSLAAFSSIFMISVD